MNGTLDMKIAKEITLRIYTKYPCVRKEIFLFTISCSSQCSTTGVTKAVVCGMVHIKGLLLLIDKSSPCGGSGFPFSLSECLTFLFTVIWHEIYIQIMRRNMLLST